MGQRSIWVRIRAIESISHSPAPLMIFAFEIKLLAGLGLMPDLAATRLSARAKELMRHVVGLQWDELRNVTFPPNLQTELRQFLHGFLIFHLGKIPSGRSAAWLES